MRLITEASALVAAPVHGLDKLRATLPAQTGKAMKMGPAGTPDAANGLGCWMPAASAIWLAPAPISSIASWARDATAAVGTQEAWWTAKR